jgi:uncharacterized protein YraI
MVTLAIPTLGMLYVLWSLARSAVKAGWNWSRPSPARRVAGSFGGAVAVALLAVLWAPQLPSGLPGLGGKPGPLYHQASFRPIAPGERGTIGDAVRGVPVLQQVVPAGELAPQPDTQAQDATPTATATATGVQIEGRTTARIDLRSAPGTAATTVGTLAAGERVIASGRSPDGAWLQVQTSGGPAWVPANAVQIQGSLSTLPFVTATATPAGTRTASPTTTRTPTPTPTSTRVTSTPTATATARVTATPTATAAP